MSEWVDRNSKDSLNPRLCITIDYKRVVVIVILSGKKEWIESDQSVISKTY